MSRARRDEMRDWLAANWALDISVREWWRRLADAGLVAPGWPEPYGRGLSPADARFVTEELAAAQVIAPPLGNIGLRLAGPTLLQHGSEELCATYLPPLLRGEEAWCQLFSEPGAGSDLPSLAARAVRDRDGWTVNGQKVWNSGADISRRGLLLARTEPDAPKRDGISYFVIDMDQPGVEARPLRQMNGEAHFCEVFLTDARVRERDVIGQVHGGWHAARTTLALERASATETVARGLVSLPSGEPAGHLDRIVGDVLARGSSAPKQSRRSAIRSREMLRLAQERGVTRDPIMRQELAHYSILTEVHRLTQQRAKAEHPRGTSSAGSMSKLTLGRICNASRDVTFAILGAHATLAGADAPRDGELQVIGLSSPGVTIGAGTDEIQRNMLGERALALPREPNADVDPRATPP